jgi:hypothetical protein
LKSTSPDAVSQSEINNSSNSLQGRIPDKFVQLQTQARWHVIGKDPLR